MDTALVLPQDRNVRLSTISGTLIRDTRDQPLDAHRGLYATTDLRITPTALGSSASDSRYAANASAWRPLR